MNRELNRRGNGWALLPFLIFIVIYLGAGLILQAQGVKMAFYQFPSVTAMFLAVLVAFIGGLYFITHHKKEEAEAMQNRQAAGNGLPPKPEERWRYIKELESRQPGVRAPTEPTAA